MEEADHGDFDAILNDKPRNSRLKLIVIALILILIIAAVIVTLVLILSKVDEKEEVLFDISDGHTKILANDSEYVYIPLFGTNDMHGFVFPRIVEINKKLSIWRR